MRLRLMYACLPCCLAASAAWASLGGSYDSVIADRTHVAAQMRSAMVGGRAVRTLTLANGGLCKEFANSQGTVFAISWRGRSKPDLRQLLGPYFSRFATETTQASGRRSHRPLTLQRSDLVVHSGGANGAFWGYAFLPNSLPANFAMSELNSVNP